MWLRYFSVSLLAVSCLFCFTTACKSKRVIEAKSPVATALSGKSGTIRVIKKAECSLADLKSYTAKEKEAIRAAYPDLGTFVPEIQDSNRQPVGGIKFMLLLKGKVWTIAQSVLDGPTRIEGLPPGDYDLWVCHEPQWKIIEGIEIKVGVTTFYDIIAHTNDQ